jgi:CRISPR system Cascade subunit CasE
MIASALHLSRADVKALKITDAYSLHIAIYSLFDDVRSLEDKQKSIPSGILYADKGGDFHGRKILMLSNRQPNIPEYGELSIKKIADSFLDYENYRFEVVMNPTKRENLSRKIIALRTREDITAWFIEKAPQWGFKISPQHLEVRETEVKRFEKKKGGQTVTQGQAKLIGRLTVTDKEKFVQSFQNGIGRGRAFGCGLLQIVPL